MDDKKIYNMPVPVLNKKEQESLDTLTARYNKLIEPSKIAKIGKKAGELVPEKIKTMAKDVGISISEQQIYSQMMDLVGKGFKTIEEQAARFSISEKQIVAKINKNSKTQISSVEEICLVRSYDIAKSLSGYKWQDYISAILEGAGTGAAGFWGIPFNLVLSTFLYFRAVQSVAMFYGYDVKNDSAELVIASDVFSHALSPANNDVNNEMTSIIGKIMVMSQAATVKQMSKKTWTEMAFRGGIPLLLTQMRALANKAAQKALEKAGQKGLENTLFKEVFEQIGKKLTKNAIGRSVPYFSAAFSALVDTAQMNQVLEFADIFYQKRFIMEKENRIALLRGEQEDIVDVDIVEEIVESDVID